MKSFFETETLSKSQSSKNVSEIENFLCAIATLSLINNQMNLCKKNLSETDLYDAMKNMQNNKSSENINSGIEFNKKQNK